MSSERPLLRVAARQTPPWSIFIYDQQNKLQIGGVMENFLKVFAETMKFDYEIVPPPDNLFGKQLKNGSWDGMIGSIERGEADFSLNSFTMSAEQENVIDFTYPFHQSNTAILTPRPKIEYDIQGVFKPFSLEVWLFTLISFVAISIAIILTEKVESKLYAYKTSDLTAKSLLWSTKALTQEGSTWLPSADGGRLIVTTWLIASLVFMSSFSGILTAMLTVPKITIPVDSIEDLVSQSKIPWRMMPGTFEMEALQQSESIIHQKAYANLAGTIPFLWEAIKDIVRGRGDYAIITTEGSIKVFMAWDYSTNGRCSLYMARKFVFSNTLQGFPFKTDSVYLEKTNRILAILKESGILNRWINGIYENATNCLKSPSHDRAAGSVLALNLEAFWGSFILLLIGFSIALMVFFFEILL